MSVNVSTINQQRNCPPQVVEDEEIFYPDNDESIIPEGILHFLLSVNLASMLMTFFAKREEVKVFGNVMLYYERGFPKKFISPDLMVCFGLKASPTKVYKLWETNVVPSVVVEFASDTTWINDVSSKLAIYQKLGVNEYYAYDVEYKHLPSPLTAYFLDNGILTEVVVENKKIMSKCLGLELVDTGETLRFFNPETNEFLMTMTEMAAELERLKAEKQNDGN